MDFRTWGKHPRLSFLAICSEGTFVISGPIFRRPFSRAFSSSIPRAFTYRFLFIHQGLCVLPCKKLNKLKNNNYGWTRTNMGKTSSFFKRRKRLMLIPAIPLIAFLVLATIGTINDTNRDNGQNDNITKDEGGQSG